MFNGKPLIWYSISEAKKSKKISNILVSTDCPKIAKISKKFGANVPFLRQKKFCKSELTLLDVCKHVLNSIESKNNKKFSSVIVLQPTSPLRVHKDIDNAIEIFKKKKQMLWLLFLKQNLSNGTENCPVLDNLKNIYQEKILFIKKLKKTIF